MLRPEEIHPALADEPVPFIFVVGNGKGSLTREHVEKDGSNCEQVNNLGLVWLRVHELRRHVAHGTDSGGVEAISITSLDWTCKAEVDYLNFKIIGKEDILRLEVTVADAVGV